MIMIPPSSSCSVLLLNAVLVILIIITTLSLLSSSSFVSATTIDGCGPNNKLEFINYNAPADHVYLDNVHNCDIIIKSSAASRIRFRTTAGSSSDTISNISLTIDNFMCANPTDVQGCITFEKPLVNTRNITINNIRQNLDITGKTSVLSVIRFYGTVSFMSSDRNNNNNNNNHFVISNIFMSGTVRRNAALWVHAIHFDDPETVISNASSVTFNNIHVSDFNEIVSTGTRVYVAAISFFDKGKIENAPKVVFRDVFVHDTNLIRSERDEVFITALSVESQSFNGLATCTTSNNELKNNINSNYNNYNNNNTNKDLFFSSLECGFVVDNLSIHDLREVSSGSDRDIISISIIKWRSSIRYFQIVFFTNIHLRRIRINHNQPTSTRKPGILLRALDCAILDPSASFFGTDLNQDAISNSILKFSNMTISDHIEMYRERSSIDARVLSVSGYSVGASPYRYFNEIEVSNMIIGNEIYLYGGGNEKSSIYGSYFLFDSFEGCRNVANDPLLIADGNADSRTCSFVVQNISVANIFQELLNKTADEDRVEVNGVYFGGSVKVTAFDLVSISNVVVENLSTLMTEEIHAVQNLGSTADTAFSGVSSNTVTNNQLESKFIIQNVVVRNVSLFLFGNADIGLAQLFAVRFVRNALVQQFLSISINQLVVQDVALYNDRDDGGFSVVAVRTRGQFEAARLENSKFLIDDAHVRNVTKNLEFRNNNNNNNPLQFRNFKVHGLDHIEGGIEDFQHFKVSNITLQSINTSNTAMENFEEVIVCAVGIESGSSGEISYGAALFRSTFLVENIFLRDLYIHASERSSRSGDRRVNAMKTVIPFLGYGNFTIQNLGIVGKLHLHLHQVPFGARVLHMESGARVSAQGLTSSSEDTSFTVRNICFHPYSSSSSSAPSSCDHNQHPQLELPLSETSVSSSVPELLKSIVAHRENTMKNNNNNRKIDIKSRDLSIFVTRIEGQIEHFATNVIENIQAHHIRTEPSEFRPSGVNAFLLSVTDFTGRRTLSPPDTFSRFTVRNLRFFDVDVYEATNTVKLYGVHVTRTVANFNKILIENIIIDRVNLTNVQTSNSVEIRVCRFETAFVTARGMALNSVTADSFNSFIQRNFFLLNSHVYSEENHPSIIPQQIQSASNFDHFFMGRSVLENVSMIAPEKFQFFRTMHVEGIFMNRDRAIYTRIPGFRRSLEFSSLYMKNIWFDGEEASAKLVMLWPDKSRNDIDIFNVSHFYTDNFTISGRRGAVFAAVDARRNTVRGPDSPPPDGLPRVFTVNNIHSKNLHMIMDDKTDDPASNRKVYIVNGLEGADTGTLVISRFDVFDFSNSSMVNCSCRQTALSPRPSMSYPNFVSFVHFEETGKIEGEAGAELRFVNLHAENVHLSSPTMESARLRVVNLDKTSNQMQVEVVKRVVFENITIENCSVVGTAREDARTGDRHAAEMFAVYMKQAVTGDFAIGSSFEMRNLAISNSHVSGSKQSRLAILWREEQNTQELQNYIFENIQVHNNTVKNSVENDPNSLVPYVFSEAHLYAIYTARKFESIASGGILLFSNISLERNVVSVTRGAHLLMLRSQDEFKKFHTFMAQSLVLRDSMVMTTGNSEIGLIICTSGIDNEVTTSRGVEVTVSSIVKFDLLFAENNSLEIVKSNEPDSATTFDNSFDGVRFFNLLKFAHIVWTNIHVSSLHIKATENVQEDRVTTTINFIWISHLESSLKAIIAGSVEYYNNSFTIENVSLQHYRLDYSPCLQGRHIIYGIRLEGYDEPFCHVSVKNIRFGNISSFIQSPSSSFPRAAAGGVQLEPIIEFYYSLDAPPHPTTAQLTSASSYSESLTPQEMIDVAFCSLEFSNITLDSFNTSLSARQASDSFYIRAIQVFPGYIVGFSSITISDITFSSIFISDLADAVSASPKQFQVVLVDAGCGIVFARDYETQNGDFPTVPEEDRRLRISNLKIDGLSIAENEGFAIHVSCLSLGKEKNSLIDNAIEDFHSILLSNFSASSVSLVGSKSTASTSTANENNNVFAQDLSCGLALVFLRGRLYRSLTGTTSTNGSMVVENFALEKKISVSSKPSSAFVFGFAATKTDQELVDGFNSVIFRNFSTSPLAFLDILSSQRSALFSHLFVRSPVSSSTTTSSSPSSLSILDFSVSSTTSLVIGSENDVSQMSLLSLNQSISGFDNVTLRNLHFSPSSVSSVTSGGHNAFTASALEINGLIDIRDSPTSFLKISNVSLCVRTSVLIFGKTTISIDALRIGGWKTATNSNPTLLENISLALSSSLLILGATERKMYSAITITENQGMTSPKTTFSNISVLFVPSSPTIPERISNINFEHSPLDPRTFAAVQEIEIENCTLNVLDSSSSNSLRTASVLSFSSTDARVAAKWNLVGNLVNSSSNETSLISFVKSSSSSDNNQIYDVTAKTSFTFLENDIEEQSPITRKPEIIGFANEYDDQPTTPPSSSSSSSSIVDFKNTEFHFKCNHWSRSYENDFETIMMDENIIQNARLYHECRSKSISLSLHHNSSTLSGSFEETLSHHRTSLTTSRSIISTVSQSENVSATSSNSETYTAPLPPPTLLRDFINTATKTAGVSLSMFAGANNAINTRKILAISSTADCGKQDADEDEVLEAGPEDNPLSLRIGSGSSKFASLRGVVLGGFAILLIWAIVMVGFALARQRVDPKQPCSFSRALYKVTMPGTLWVPASSMFPVAVNSCVVIAKRFEGEVIDIVMMIIGFAVAGVATVCVLFWIKHRVDKHEVLLPEGVEESEIEQYLENIENGGKKNQDEKEKGLLALFKNLADNDDTDKKRTKPDTTDEEDDSPSKEKDKKKNKKKTSKPKNNNIDYTALLFSKLVVIFDWLTTPKQKYAKTKFSQRFEPLFNWTTVLYFVPLSYISVLVMEIVEANTTLCSKNDRSCCEGGIVTMCVFAGIDLMLIILMKNPFLVPIDRYLFPATSLLSFISSILITIQFYDATSSLSVDGEDMRPENERVDFLDTLVILSQAAFIISMINCCFNGLAEFKNGYCSFKEAKEKKQLKEQRDRQRAANTKKELAEKKKREKLDAAEEEMKVIEKKKKYEEEGLKKGASRRYMALLDDEELELVANEEESQTLLLPEMSPRSVSEVAPPKEKRRTRREKRQK